MATATARGFEGDGNGQHRKDEIIERARSYMAEGAPFDPERIQNVGGAVVRAELTPYGWQQASINAGYLALRNVLPQFNTPLPGYPPTTPHSENYIG